MWGDVNKRAEVQDALPPWGGSYAKNPTLSEQYETPRREKGLVLTHTPNSTHGHKYTFIQTLPLSIYCRPFTEDRSELDR